MIEILDTTLREGEQTPYVNFTIDEKVEMELLKEQARRARKGTPGEQLARPMRS